MNKLKSDFYLSIGQSRKGKQKEDEEEKGPAEKVLKFKGKDLLVADGTRLHYTPLEELVGAICLSFHDVCRFSKTMGWDKGKDLAYFVDAR